MADGVVETDGRRAKRIANRETVIDAAVACFEEGRYSPGIDEIAERAGLSPRSLFRYFDDVQDLIGAAITTMRARAGPLVELEIDAAEPTARKIRAVVSGRCRLHEAMAAGLRAARANAHRHEAVGRQLGVGRVRFREQLRTVFAPELGQLGRAEAARVLGVIDITTSFESWDLLRQSHAMSHARVEATQVLALDRLFGVDPSG